MASLRREQHSEAWAWNPPRWSCRATRSPWRRSSRRGGERGRVTAIHGRPGEISGQAEGTIHISNVSEEYTEDIHDMFRLGDVVRAKVIQTKPSLQLTTAEGLLGVVKALRGECRA